MNKNGFTLVELLVAIALLSLLSGIAVISYTRIVSKSQLASFTNYERTMYDETVIMLMDHPELIPKSGSKTFYLSDITGLEPFINPVNKDDTCSTSYVQITRNNYTNTETNTKVDALKYKICLICKNSNYNVRGNSCLTLPETTP